MSKLGNGSWHQSHPRHQVPALDDGGVIGVKAQSQRAIALVADSKFQRVVAIVGNVDPRGDGA